jgi:hypothetical protein
MKEYFLKIVSHPVTHYNVITIGMLITIGALHNHTHFTMDKDANGYVYRWCKKNPDICTHRGNGY